MNWFMIHFGNRVTDYTKCGTGSADQAQVKNFVGLFQETIADIKILIKNIDENNQYDFKSNVRRLQNKYKSLVNQYID